MNRNAVTYTTPSPGVQDIDHSSQWLSVTPGDSGHPRLPGPAAEGGEEHAPRAYRTPGAARGTRQVSPPGSAAMSASPDLRFRRSASERSTQPTANGQSQRLPLLPSSRPSNIIISTCAQGGLRGGRHSRLFTSRDGRGTSPGCCRAVSRPAGPR